MRCLSLPVRLVAAALLVLVAGCSAGAALADMPDAAAQPLSPNGLSLTADQTAYPRGATARLALRNGAQIAATTGVLECAQIETWASSGWTASPVGNDRACILIVRMLQPGETLTGGVPLDVPPGTYRLAQSVSLEGAEVAETVTTAAFRVQ